MIRFYTPEIEQSGTMPMEESMHCCRVLRKQPGDKVQTIDGRGKVYECTITDANPKGATLQIDSVIESKPHWKGELTLAVAPTKNSDRMEWLIEKAVEMGIDEIVLLKCQHSERKVMKHERLLKIMISAMKQSLKATLPALRGPIEINEFIEQERESTSVKIFGYCDCNTKRQDFNSDIYKRGENLIVMIGPEGDFSPEEVTKAIDAGFIPVTFGQSRLRTETAAIFAVAAFHCLQL